MDLPRMVRGASQKGLDVLGTGDCFQPTWRAMLERTLVKEKGTYILDGMAFILQAEVEDAASVHHVILLPDFDAVDAIKATFAKHSTNIDHEWGGRPRVNLPPAEIVETCTAHGALAGPAHAFTPFKSAFRQGKFDGMRAAYGAREKDVHFLELGLSANSEYADRLSCLHRLTFMSNSDAHAPTPAAIGREFNRLEADAPSFEEIDIAIRRRDGRKFTANIGFNPRLGKYNVLFCKSCRRRMLVQISPIGEGDANITVDGDLIHVTIVSEGDRLSLLRRVDAGKVSCPACEKRGAIRLGVSERVELLADLPPGEHPAHRPPYHDMVPLLEILRAATGTASTGSKRVVRLYEAIIARLGVESSILLDSDARVDLAALARDAADARVLETAGSIIAAFKAGTVAFVPGGGGTFGQVRLDA